MSFDLNLRLDEPAEDAIFVRPSAHSSWLMCQLSVQHSRTRRYKDADFDSMQAARGTFVHLLNEMYLTGKPCHNTEDAYELFTTTADIPKGVAPTRLREITIECFQAHEAWITQFWLTEGKLLDVVSTEKRMRMPIGHLQDGREVWLRGTADLITGPPKVWDWKTSTSGWTAKKLNEMTQHMFYAALAEYELGVPHTEAAYVVYNFKTGTWEWSAFTLPIERPAMNRALYEMYKMAVVLAHGAAMASPAKRGASWGQDGRGWWCSAKWCGAWDWCDGKYILDDGKCDGLRDPLITWK